MDSWDKYYGRVGNKPSSMAVATVLCVRREDRGAALDLGAGNLRNARYFKEAGFRQVVAVDRSETSRAYAIPGVELIIMPIEKYAFPLAWFDAVVCLNTLFFLKKDIVTAVLSQMYATLRPGGTMAFNVLGIDDPWARDGDKSSFSREEVSALAASLQDCVTAETRQVPPADGEKSWHVWQALTTRP